MDEVLFPFSHGYSQWRSSQGLVSFDPSLMTKYDFTTLLGAEQQEGHCSAFIEAEETLQLDPLPGALDAVAQLLSDRHQIKIATNRYQTQSRGTLSWLSRWVPDLSQEVVFCRSRPGAAAKPKAEVAAEWGADVLIDDVDHHLSGLGSTRGLLFGDYSWNQLSKHPRAEGWHQALEWLDRLDSTPIR